MGTGPNYETCFFKATCEYNDKTIIKIFAIQQTTGSVSFNLGEAVKGHVNIIIELYAIELVSIGWKGYDMGDNNINIWMYSTAPLTSQFRASSIWQKIQNGTPTNNVQQIFTINANQSKSNEWLYEVRNQYYHNFVKYAGINYGDQIAKKIYTAYWSVPDILLNIEDGPVRTN